MMLDYIIINSPISPIEANYFTANNTFKNFKLTPTGGKTTELSDDGIIEVSIWFNTKKMISEPLINPYCSINATIDVHKLKGSNLDALFEAIEKHLPISSSKIYNFKKLNDLEWKIKSASFIYNFTGTAIETYYKMLCGGYDLPKYKLQKKVSKTVTFLPEKKTIKMPQKDKNVKPIYRDCFLENRVNVTEYSGIRKIQSNNYNESVHIAIELRQQFILDDDENKRKNEDGKIERKLNGDDHEIQYVTKRKFYDKLQIKIQTRRNKIRSICNKKDENGNIFIPNRNVKIFLENEAEIDKKLFIDYITLISGKGDFYKYKKAEKIIRTYQSTSEYEKDISKNKKDKMCDVLRAIGSYKGISNYLEHVEDKKIVYESMRTTRKREYALALLKDIQKCGINPLTIPIRADQEKLVNLIGIYQSPNEKFIFSQTPIEESSISYSEDSSVSNQYTEFSDDSYNVFE